MERKSEIKGIAEESRGETGGREARERNGSRLPLPDKEARQAR